MTRAEIRRLRRTWRGGLPGFGATPAVPLAPTPRPAAGDDAAAERLLTTQELAVIWDGWKGGPR